LHSYVVRHNKRDYIACINALIRPIGEASVARSVSYYRSSGTIARRHRD